MYVSVFTALASEGTDARALFDVTSEREGYKVHSHFDRSLEGGPFTLKYRGSMCLKDGLRDPQLVGASFSSIHHLL
ncbi:hypothetical protein SAY86_004818 [Trapa natans]|uniref:Uncharacterized protein n=1 Tax=Trapa natans TaxID=22666 RepID=A0AAN7MJ54_TRANT|nr:hypothetical protein SAY86_004818 [Trapa natans]